MINQSLLTSISFITILCLSMGIDAETVTTKYFSIHYVLGQQDKERFHEKVINELDPFVEYWIKAGVPLSPDEKLRIYIANPPSSMTRHEVIVELFGDIFFEDFANLETKADENASNLIALVKIFTLKYPCYFRKILEREISIEKLKRLITSYKKDLSTNAHFALFNDVARYLPFTDYSADTSNAIILGSSTKLEIQEHMFLKRDVVFHEIGHWFFHMLLNKTGKFSNDTLIIPSSLNEMFADIVSASYLNDPFHNRKKDQSCYRNLSSHKSLLDKHLWASSDPHERNAPVAHFLWDAFTALGLENFSFVLIKTMKETLAVYPIYHHQFSSRQVFKDMILECGLTYINDYSTFLDFSQKISGYAQEKMNIVACEELMENYLGTAEYDTLYAEIMIKNSPTNRGEYMQFTKLNDKEVSFWFSNIGPKNTGPIKLNIMSDNTTKTYVNYAFRRIDYLSLLFSPLENDDAMKLAWEVNARLVQANLRTHIDAKL